jgi:hypothetical protein
MEMDVVKALDDYYAAIKLRNEEIAAKGRGVLHSTTGTSAELISSLPSHRHRPQLRNHPR